MTTWTTFANFAKQIEKSYQSVNFVHLKSQMTKELREDFDLGLKHALALSEWYIVYRSDRDSITLADTPSLINYICARVSEITEGEIVFFPDLKEEKAKDVLPKKFVVLTVTTGNEDTVAPMYFDTRLEATGAVYSLAVLGRKAKIFVEA